MEHDLAALAFVNQLPQVLGPERRVSAQESIGNDAHGPHVDRLAMTLALHDFGGSVAERARHSRQNFGAVAEGLGNTKVGQH